MATSTDPTFGGDFDADLFRTAISNTMNMGLPEDTSERVTFRWHTDKTFGNADTAGRPYDFTATPATSVSKPDVQVPAAVEFLPGRSGGYDGTVFGNFDDKALAVITVLDSDYPSVEGCDEVILGGDTYLVKYVAPPIGLFSVTIYQIHCQALDET